jgi:hypothetical protein
VTDNRLPILADGLFDGGLAADVAPKDLRAAVNVLSAAGRPGSEAELATMAARVRQFSAEINAAANTPARPADPPTNHPIAGPAAAFDVAHPSYEAYMSADALRSNPLFATRITRKALTIVAITMLAAGTAAAAAGGALPMFQKDDANAIVHEDVDSNVIVDLGDHADNEQSGDQSPPVTQPATDDTVVVDEGAFVMIDFFGKCMAWTNGSAQDATSSSFDDLRAAANEASLTIDGFCGTIVTPSISDDEDKTRTDAGADDKPAVTTTPTDQADEEPADEEKPKSDDPAVTPTTAAPPPTTAATPTTTTPPTTTPPTTIPAGTGNGNGNSGHGNGHGNDHGHDGDDHGNGNGNGNGNGHGNDHGSGNGHDDHGNGNGH